MHLKNPIQNIYLQKALQLQKQKSLHLQPHVKTQLFGLNHGDDAHARDGDGDGDGAHHREVTMRKSS
ncbi:Uncharacterised protein [Acinetobacter baumannii]|nr:Uncharacterised protein [Acinetobacter baumannii]